MDILKYVCCLLKLSVRNSENGFAFLTASLREANFCCSGCGSGSAGAVFCTLDSGWGGIAEGGFRLSFTEVEAVAIPRPQAAVGIMHVGLEAKDLDTLAAAP